MVVGVNSVNVKNLHDTETYHRCVELVAEGKFTESILIPMKWEIEYTLGSKPLAEKFISNLDEIFGKSESIYLWGDNYDAPWFFTISKLIQIGSLEEWCVMVNLTTDEQLSYMTIAFPDTNIRKERLTA